MAPAKSQGERIDDHEVRINGCERQLSDGDARMDRIDGKLDGMDVLLRGDGKELGLVARVVNIEDSVGTVKKLLYTLLVTVLTTIAVMVTKSVFEKKETHSVKPQATVEVHRELAR